METAELEGHTSLVHNLAAVPLQDAKRYYHDAMAVLAGAVNIVTTQFDKTRVGFAATAVCSVSDAPPTLLVCLNHAASVYSHFRDTATLCINVLAADQADVAKKFGGMTSQSDRFAFGQWGSLVTGSPFLMGAAASFDCRVTRRVSVGTHDVMFCEVECVQYAEDAGGLMYFRRGYHKIK